MSKSKKKQDAADQLTASNKNQQDTDYWNKKTQQQRDEERKSLAKAASGTGTEEENKKKSKPTSLAIQGLGDLELIIADYNKRYSNLPPYNNENPAFKPHETKNGITTLFFESEEEAVRFAMGQAAAGRKFKILDEKQCVIAVSDGLTLFHSPSNEPFKEGDPLVSKPTPAMPKPLKNSQEQTTPDPVSPGPGLKK